MDDLLRRVLDITVAVAGLVVLSPLMVGLALWIWISSPGPILHRAERAGWKGRLFVLYKFRSMVVNAAVIGPGVTTKDDPRVTRVGRFLRRTKLDELPQLFNVLKGDMSLVGPRPEDERFVRLYSEEQRRILDFKPGITSPASLRYKNEEELLKGDDWQKVYLEQLMPEKIRIDLEYLTRRNVINDMVLILSTIRALVQ